MQELVPEDEFDHLTRRICMVKYGMKQDFRRMIGESHACQCLVAPNEDLNMPRLEVGKINPHSLQQIDEIEGKETEFRRAWLLGTYDGHQTAHSGNRNPPSRQQLDDLLCLAACRHVRDVCFVRQSRDDLISTQR